MPEKLNAATGRTTGTRSSRRLRAEGLIPGVLYGHGIDPISLAVNGREVRDALSGDSGMNTVLTLNVDGEEHLALARHIQNHPTRGTAIHIDFQVVSRSEKLSATVPVTLVGEKADSEVVIEQMLFEVTVLCSPLDIPTGFEVEISKLELGQQVLVSELDLPENVDIDTPGDEVVVAAKSPATVDLGGEAETGDGAGEGAEGSGAGVGSTDNAKDGE